MSDHLTSVSPQEGVDIVPVDSDDYENDDSFVEEQVDGHDVSESSSHQDDTSEYSNEEGEGEEDNYVEEQDREEEEEQDDVFNDTTIDQPSLTFADNIANGFTMLRRNKSTSNTTPTFNNSVIVSFLDPTTHANTSGPSLYLYKRFTRVFQRDYQSKLSYIPYAHYRSNTSGGIIENLQILPILNQSGMVVATEVPSNLPWNENNSDNNNDNDNKKQGTNWATRHRNSATSQSSDVSNNSSNNNASKAHSNIDRHNVPMAHVYIVTCSSLEQYRTKVKPTLQAFCRQVQEGVQKPANNTNNAPSSSTPTSSARSMGSSTPGEKITESMTPTKANDSYSGNFVIIYVPLSARSGLLQADVTTVQPQQSSSSLSDTQQTSRVLFSRIAAARQRVRNSIVAAVGTAGDDEVVAAASAAASVNSEAYAQALAQAKTERDILKRLGNDFGDNNVCSMASLASLVDNGQDGDRRAANGEESEEWQRQKLEWSNFMRTLGSAVVSGFQHRCRQFDDELRALDSQRGNRRSNFSLSQFFLLKESFALTFEQMNLPDEALLQYAELRAVVPDLNSSSIRRQLSNDGLNEDHDEDLRQIALAGRVLEFRKELQKLDDLVPIADIIEKYLFAREITLLFKTGSPNEVLKRCLQFVQTIYKTLTSRQDQGDDNASLLDAEKWAFNFCWQVKDASENYHKIGVDINNSKKTAKQQNEITLFARQLGDLVAFARLRLLQAGMLKLGKESLPPLLDWQNLPVDLTEKWPPRSSQASSTESNGADVDKDIDFDTFFDDAIADEKSFESRYIYLLNLVISLGQHAGYHRVASRYMAELAEIYTKNGNTSTAASLMRSVADSYAQDMWSTCSFLYLFRVAKFQRQSSDHREYLDTLINAFNERNLDVASATALDTLQADLNGLVGEDDLAGVNLSMAPLFRPTCGISVQDSTQLSSRQLYTVGDSVDLSLLLESFLPNTVEIDVISVILVPYQRFIASVEDRAQLSDKDASQILKVEGSALQKGLNTVKVSWIPLNPGQHVIYATRLKWKGVEFEYEASVLQRIPTRIDVAPSEPTQSISVKPPFLIPGHEQPVTITLKSGTDVVKKATLQLVCTSGLYLIPPDADEDKKKWTPSCSVSLPPCSSDGTSSITTMIKSDKLEDIGDSTQTLHVHVTTNYTFASVSSNNNNKDTVEDSAMAAHVMEVAVPTLGKSAISVEGVKLIPYQHERVLLSICLKCHSTAPFKLKSWNITLPQTLDLAEDGDTNSFLADTDIISGEYIFFSFLCHHVDKHTHSHLHDGLIEINLVDEAGTNFDEKIVFRTPALDIPKVELQNLQPLSVKLQLDSTSGNIDESIKATYTVDTSLLESSTSVISYCIDSEHSSWIVTGTVCGRVQFPETSVTVCLTPTVAGSIESFPPLFVKVYNKNKSKSVIVPTFFVDKTRFDCAATITATVLANSDLLYV